MLAGSLGDQLISSLQLSHTVLAGNVRVPIFYRTQTFMLHGCIIFDKYINNLDFEYETRGFFKLVYLYTYAFDSSWMTWNRATLPSKIATLACHILYTLVYFLSKWGNSGIKTHDKYSRYFLVGLRLA